MTMASYLAASYGLTILLTLPLAPTTRIPEIKDTESVFKNIYQIKLLNQNCKSLNYHSSH